jgi:hypothetical protein
MRRIFYSIAALLIVTTSCFGLAPAFTPKASAATPPPKAAATPPNPTYGQALEIAPPVIYLTANPGQTLKTQVFLRDISSGDLIVTGEANDFTASGEDGTPKIILNNDNNPNPYSLKNWIAAPASLRLVPREVKTMAITINVPANGSPGGHYGIIRFTATPPSLKNSGVSLSTSLGALILLTVNGKVNENLNIKELSVNKGGKTGSLFQSGPLNFVTRLENTGNVHEQPTGQITVTNMFGKNLATVNINLPPRNILPASTRKFTSALDSSVIGNKKLFGRYTAKLKVTYGQDKKVVTSTTTFWVIPYKLIAGLIIALIAGFFLLRYALRRYNRYVLKQANKKRRK